MEKYWNIKAPCSQNWDQMNAMEQGRYCDRCCKTVIDFSDWETGAILEYLNTNDATCGRFQVKQLGLIATYTEEEIIPLLSRSRMSLLQKTAALIVLCFALSANPELFAQKQAPPVKQTTIDQLISKEADSAILKTGNVDRKSPRPPKENPDCARPMIMGFVAPANRATPPEAGPKEKPNAKPSPKAARPRR